MSIKKKFATAVATASLLAGLFGSAFVPSALAAREVPLDTPSVSVTETWTADDDYIMPTLGANDDVTGADRVFWATTVDDLYYSNNYDDDYVYMLPEVATDDVAIDYYLYTKTGADVATADLKATSSSSVIKVKWAYSDAGTSDNCADVDSDDVFTTSDTVTDVDGISSDDLYQLCIHGNGKPGTATISVVANGVTLAPVTITVVGDISSLTVTPMSGYVAEDNDNVDDFFTVIAKDSAGTVINGPQTGVAGGVYLDNPTFGDILGSEDNPVNQQGDEIDFISTSSEDDDAENALGNDNYAYTKYDLNMAACVSETAAGEGDGDAGEAYSLAAAIENDDDDVVTSNKFTITCTGGLDGARITNVTPEATTGDLLYDETGALADDRLTLSATVVDAGGRPLGEGAGDVEAAFGLPTFAPAAYDAELFYTTTGDIEVIGGVWEFAYLEPDTSRAGSFSYSITWDDANLDTAGDQELAKALKYTAAFAGFDGDIAKSRNAAKTVATVVADFGEAGQYGKIQFVIQNASGAQRLITLPAGSDGEATLVFSRRNQRVSVTAYLMPFGSMSFQGETDTVSIRFR